MYILLKDKRYYSSIVRPCFQTHRVWVKFKLNIYIFKEEFVEVIKIILFFCFVLLVYWRKTCTIQQV